MTPLPHGDAAARRPRYGSARLRVAVIQLKRGPRRQPFAFDQRRLLAHRPARQNWPVPPIRPESPRGRKRSLGPKERQEVGVQLVLVRVGEAVRRR